MCFREGHVNNWCCVTEEEAALPVGIGANFREEVKGKRSSDKWLEVLSEGESGRFRQESCCTDASALQIGT